VSDADDPGVAAVTLLVPRSDRREQLGHDFRLEDEGRNVTASRQVATLCERDQALGEPPRFLRLGHAGLDALVLEERRDQFRSSARRC